jgi:ABC-type glycerol-3-phosphate transport system substrate-binding protein
MNLRKPLYLCVVFVLLTAVMLSACAPAAPPAAPAEEPAAPAEEPAPVEEAAPVEEPAAPAEEEVAPAEEEAVPAEFGLEAVSGEEVVFQGWQFATDVVLDNVSRYNSEMGGNVVYSTIAGDYSAIMESKLIAGAPLDILYGHTYDAVRYYEGGWLLPVDQLPNFEEEIAPDLYPHIIQYWSYDGHVLGLSYFTSVLGIIGVNLDKLEEGGLTPADYPATWDELYDQLYVLRDNGIQYPYLPTWYVEQWGIPWAFLIEVLNRGGVDADPVTHAPGFTADGPAGDTLRDWKRIWNDGIVQPEVLSYKEADYIEAWESGRYVYAPTMAYNLRRFNNPEFSTFAGRCDFVPYQGQPWGIVDAGLYLMTQRDRTLDHDHDVMAFMSWYGFQDQHGEPFVAQRWLEDFNLFSAYQSVMDSPEARSHIADSLADPDKVDALMEVYENAQYPMGTFNVVWSSEFQAFLRETLQDFLLNDQPVEDTIDLINNKIIELNQIYGVGQ